MDEPTTFTATADEVDRAPSSPTKAEEQNDVKETKEPRYESEEAISQSPAEDAVEYLHGLRRFLVVFALLLSMFLVR